MSTWAWIVVILLYVCVFCCYLLCRMLRKDIQYLREDLTHLQKWADDLEVESPPPIVAQPAVAPWPHHERSSCPCDPSGSDGLTCPDPDTGRPLCADPAEQVAD